MRARAIGSSMFPFVPSGSMLELRPALPGSVRVGDIVVYAGEHARDHSPRVIAHRVIAVADGVYEVRGDSQAWSEQVPASALVGVATRVERGRWQYRTGSAVGRVLGRWAVRRGLAFQLVGAAARLLPRRARVRWVEPAELVAQLATISLRPRSIAPEVESSRDSLLRGLKHELRTPLNAILGFADLLLGELDGPLDSEERENVSVVRESGWNLLGLINEVLDLATAVMVPGEPLYEETDVFGLLEEVRRDLEQRCGMRPVHVRVVGAFDGWEQRLETAIEVRLERRLLTRVLRALGDVALFKTSAGQISLGARMDDAGASGERQLHLWVGADGFGEQPTEQPATFALGAIRPGDRGQRVASMQFSIVRALLARHDAQLEVAEIDGARVLSLRLPLQLEEPSELPLVGLQLPAADEAAEVTLALSYLAAMGHDLRTPLNAILGFADLLGLQERRPWSDAQRRSLEIVRERALDLGVLVDDMIDWAKLEARELVLTREVQPVLPLIQRALASAQKRSGSRGLTIELKADAQLGYVSVDGARCEQALLGLLDHAIRSNPGPTVRLRAQRTAALLKLEVLDPGLEIRAEDQSAVFDAFRPSHAPTGQRIAGLQLGPAVARGLFRAHGGDVWFESRPGRGTTFTATLPALTNAEHS